MRSVPLAALALLASPLLAQAPLVEKIEVSVVNVDVTVTDRSGAPVRGLARDDFEVFEDGVAQTLTNFYAVEQQAGPQTQDDERFRRKVMLLIDDHAMSPYERDRALRRIEDFINDRFRGGEYDWSIAGVSDGELHMLLPPTSDKKAIRDALDKIRRRRMPLPEPQPLWTRIGASRVIVDALIDAMRAFGSVTGKKIVLLLTPQLLPDDRTVANLSATKAITLIRNDLIHEANASNVNLYIVNPEGVATGDSSMYWMARETGGRLFPGNRVEQSLREFDTGSSNYYSLGYSPKQTSDGRYHRIEVRVKKGDYALQYRDGYSSLPESQQIERTLNSPFGTFMVNGSSIPLTVSFGQRREVEDGVIVTMKTAVPADKLTFISSGEGSTSRVDIFVSLFDWTGRNVFSIRRTREANQGKTGVQPGTFNETTEFFVRHGKPYRVVVAVRDEVSESVGVTQQVVEF